MLALRRLSPLLLLAAALFALAVLFAPGAQPAGAQSVGHKPPTVTLTVSPDPVVEGSPVTVTVSISATRSAPTTIPLVIPAKGATDASTGHDLGVSAEAGDHGSLASITIPGGQSSATGTITTAHDADTDDEVFLVLLGDPPAPTGNPPRRAWEHGSPNLELVKILDDEGPRWVSLIASPSSDVRETDDTVYILASLRTFDGIEAPLSRNVTIPVTITDGSAEAGDHGSLSSITITAGDSAGVGAIDINADTDADNETFTVALGSPLPSGVRAGPTPSVEIRILDESAGVHPNWQLSVDADPACFSTVSVTTVTPVKSLVLTPAPAAEEQAEYRVLATETGAWRANLPIRTSGSSVPTSFNTFAGLREAFPGFRGFEFRLADHHRIKVLCTWTFQTGGV